MTMDNSKGIIYVATGEEFVQEALKSVSTVQDQMDVPITLFTDKDSETMVPGGVFDSIKMMECPKYGFEDKIYGIKNTPYKRTIYLDTDTYLTSEISELFDMLDSLDLVAAHDVMRWKAIANNYTNPSQHIEGIPSSFPEYNTGVLVYKNTSKTNSFLSDWESEYKYDDPHDQPAFRRALYHSDIRFGTLLPEYNYIAHSPGYAFGTVKIIHHRLLDIDTPGAKKKVDVGDFAININKKLGRRVHYFVGSIPKYTHHDQVPPIRFRIKKSIQKDGYVPTIVKALTKLKSKIVKNFRRPD